MLKTIYTLLVLMGTTQLFAQAQSQSDPDKKPNIIFILTDDQRWDALGHAGNELIHTPEMDRLAEEGAYFKNAMVTTPICAASRATIFTGLYERTHAYTFQKKLQGVFPLTWTGRGVPCFFPGLHRQSF